MAFINLGSKTWGSSPAIDFTFSYEKKRDGADMQYRVKIVVDPLTGSHYFGYPIYVKISMNGSSKVTKTLKSSSPSQWSSAITYTTSWYTISNKTTGTTSLSINLYSGSGNSRNNTYSYKMGVDPAASVLGSISNFTIGNAINIPITKYSSGFKDSLTISVAGMTIKTISNITNGYDVSFSSTELTNIYKKIPSSTTATFTFKLTTKSGSTTVGTSTKTATGTIPSSVKPSISSVTVTEANGTTAALGVYVKNKSKLKFVISASAGSGSSISSYKTTVNGASYSGSTITTNTITASGTVTATITVTDKRGRTASTTKNVSVLNYANPYITSLTAFRCNSDGSANEKGTYMKISLTAGVTSLNGKNTYAYTIQYKKSSVSSYKTINISGQDQTCTYSTVIAIESTSSYDVRATAADYFTSVTISAQPVPSVFRTLSFKAGGHGIAIGKIAEEDNCLDIALKTKFQDQGSWVLRRGPWWKSTDTSKNADNVINEINFAYSGKHNVPTTGTLVTFSCASNNYPWQIMTYYYNSNDTFIRSFNGDKGTWNSWVRLLATTNVQNTLSSTSTTLPLSAAQGKTLNDKINSYKVLWTGGYYMASGQTVTLSESVSSQKTGILLVWSGFANNEVQNYNWVYTIVPKWHVANHSGNGVFASMGGITGITGFKYVYVNDKTISGHANNTLVGTKFGVEYQNNKYVLRAVIGF